jgi:hypothetical protein
MTQGMDRGSFIPLSALAAFVVFWTQIWRSKSSLARAFVGRPDRIYLVLTAHAALFCCLISFQGFPDRFWLDPLMAIAAGWLVAEIANRLAPRAPRIPWHGLARGASATALVVLFATGRWDFRAIKGLTAQREAATALGEILDAGYSVYAVGCTHLLAFNHASNYTPFGFFFRGVEEYLYVKTQGRGYTPLRDGKLPDVVLVSRGTYLGKQPWFEREYIQARRREFRAQAVQVWLRSHRGASRVSRDIRGREGAPP